MQRNVPATPPFAARAQLARELFARRIMHPAFDRTLDGLRKFGAWRKGPRARPLLFLAFLGPGLIAANAGNDAGAVATWSSVGAQYGYALLWVLVIITISLSVVQEMCARMGAATGKGLSDLIRERFGVRGAAFAMSTLLVANVLITISEFAGIAAACELFGISKYITVPLAAIGIWLVITRGSYERVEKIFLVMSFAFFAYPIAAILAHPNWRDVAHGFVPSVQLKSTYLLLLSARSARRSRPICSSSSSPASPRRASRWSITSRSATRPTSARSSPRSSSPPSSSPPARRSSRPATARACRSPSAEQAAQALVPFLGKYAEALFGIGLLGASLLAAAVLPLATAYCGLRVVRLRAWRQLLLPRGADLPGPLHRHAGAGRAGRAHPRPAADPAHHRRAGHQRHAAADPAGLHPAAGQRPPHHGPIHQHAGEEHHRLGDGGDADLALTRVDAHQRACRSSAFLSCNRPDANPSAKERFDMPALTEFLGKPIRDPDGEAVASLHDLVVQH